MQFGHVFFNFHLFFEDFAGSQISENIQQSLLRIHHSNGINVVFVCFIISERLNWNICFSQCCGADPFLAGSGTFSSRRRLRLYQFER